MTRNSITMTTNVCTYIHIHISKQTKNKQNKSQMFRVPKSIIQQIEASCTMQNVRGASSWRQCNDGKGHKSNIMTSLVQGRKAEYFVWSVLKAHPNVIDLQEPNFNRDTRATSDMAFKDASGKVWQVEVKSCAKKKRDRNGYQFQVRRKRGNKIKVVDPYTRTDGKEGGDTLFFCVMVKGDICQADTIFGMKRSDLVCSDPNRTDLKGLKYAIHPRLNNAKLNLF